jgi:hypothetical protein
MNKNVRFFINSTVLALLISISIIIVDFDVRIIVLTKIFYLNSAAIILLFTLAIIERGRNNRS